MKIPVDRIFVNHSGSPVNKCKAVELFRRSSELGSSRGDYYLAHSYFLGEGIERDKKKAIHYYQLAAMKGHNTARYNLGVIEGKDGNFYRAMKHHLIAAKCGDVASLQTVKVGYTAGHVSKEDFEKTLREHQASQDETKSEARAKAKTVRGI